MRYGRNPESGACRILQKRMLKAATPKRVLSTLSEITAWKIEREVYTMAINSTGIDACAPEDCSSCTADCSSRVDLKANVIELTTDEGEVIRCQVLLNYEMEGRRYLAVMPLADNPDGDIYLFRVAEGETGLENIEDEEEHSRAAHAFGIAMEKAQKERLQS